jgi:hypothetical protein
VLVVEVVQTQILESLVVEELAVVELVLLKALGMQLLERQILEAAEAVEPALADQLPLEGQELLSCVTTQH